MNYTQMKPERPTVICQECHGVRYKTKAAKLSLGYDCKFLALCLLLVFECVVLWKWCPSSPVSLVLLCASLRDMIRWESNIRFKMYKQQYEYAVFCAELLCTRKCSSRTASNVPFVSTATVTTVTNTALFPAVCPSSPIVDCALPSAVWSVDVSSVDLDFPSVVWTVDVSSETFDHSPTVCPASLANNSAVDSAADSAADAAPASLADVAFSAAACPSSFVMNTTVVSAACSVADPFDDSVATSVACPFSSFVDSSVSSVVCPVAASSVYHPVGAYTTMPNITATTTTTTTISAAIYLETEQKVTASVTEITPSRLPLTSCFSLAPRSAAVRSAMSAFARTASSSRARVSHRPQLTPPLPLAPRFRSSRSGVFAFACLAVSFRTVAPPSCTVKQPRPLAKRRLSLAPRLAVVRSAMSTFARSGSCPRTRISCRSLVTPCLPLAPHFGCSRSAMLAFASLAVASRSTTSSRCAIVWPLTSGVVEDVQPSVSFGSAGLECAHSASSFAPVAAPVAVPVAAPVAAPAAAASAAFEFARPASFAQPVASSTLATPAQHRRIAVPRVPVAAGLVPVVRSSVPSRPVFGPRSSVAPRTTAPSLSRDPTKKTLKLADLAFRHLR